MTQELQHKYFDDKGSYIPGAGIINPKSFGVGNATKVYRKLQCGDKRSATVSLPLEWVKGWDGSKLCGYVRMTLNPDSSILLEGV